VAPTAQTLPAAQTLPTAQTAPTPPTVPLWRANESPAAPVDSWSIGQAQSPTGSPTEAPTEAQADPAEEQTANRFPFGQSASKSETAAELRDPIPLRSPKAPAPRSSRELSDAMAEFDALMASGSDSAADPAADPVARDLAGAQDELDQGDGVDVFDSLLDVEPSIETPPETSTAPSSDSAPVWPLATDPFNADPFNTDPFNTDPFGAARRVHETSSAEPAPTAEAAEPEPVAEAPRAAHDVDHHYVAPVGHWSRQAADDGAQDAIDDEPNYEGLDAAEPDAAVALGRTVGTTGGAVTANHLVMSSVPTANDLLKPFSPTGEIMITGTIDLPRSLGTTGAHPARYDHSDVDTLLEASDREDSNVDSAPVRAIRAVSTHTSSRGLIGTGKPPRSSRLPMILAVSTAAVAAVVVVLFVAGIVLRVF
jgi:hypothetical protein